MYRDAWRRAKGNLLPTHFGASNIEKATTSVKKEVRGRAGQVEGADQTKKGLVQPRKSLFDQAMMNGEECEACQ